MNDKRLKGQFFTTKSPFGYKLFLEWYDLIDKVDEEIFIEPFAGSNNIIKMISDSNISQPRCWRAFDIDPPKENCMPSIEVSKRDIIKDFPTGYRIGITNPPYLAKNSATRRGFEFPNSEYNDLYKISLSLMLENLEYVAAIIPESFITQGLFRERLYGVVSINSKIFEDTSFPVCLALFVPDIREDFVVWRGDEFIGTYSYLMNELDSFSLNNPLYKQTWKFSDIDGLIGLHALDKTTGPTIKFLKGSEIDESRVNSKARQIVRISGGTFNDDNEVSLFIDKCNELLRLYRKTTQDVFLTAFKGLRKDNKYRRRLSFADAETILNKAYELIKEEI